MQSKIRRGVGLRKGRLPPPSTLTANIVGRINDRELLALTRINKAPPLQATMYSHY